jgi:dTDP-4-dehydrorhamnose reductase
LNDPARRNTSEATDQAPPVALWGGVECTVNRVGDRYFGQLERNGHATRTDDFDRIAALGVRALRFPVIWERTAPDDPDSPDANWAWSDAGLDRLRALDIAPIVGLLHHGSGPPHTSLVSACFPEKLAAYAGAVARRYPWVDRWTPVNEPLTTARFSGLYGVWYPHGRDPATFVRALVNECRGTVLAMRAIREVNPRAQLVQTDDLGKYYGTPTLAYQCAFNNMLRWLGWDLLTGRVTPGHPLWGWLLEQGQASPGELHWLADNACPPDVLGVNHYITSERYIDERLDRYPAAYHGGNGRTAYADVEAVRCLGSPTPGLRGLLGEAWERYRLPIAVTEVQLAGPREEQLRWFSAMWEAAIAARDDGVDLRAVTAWSLFGAFDWNCLVVREAGFYESGAFDVRGDAPRPTALAALMQTVSTGAPPDHPVLDGPGWWHRPGRHFGDPVEVDDLPRRPLDGRLRSHPADASAARPARPILLTGATGTLGRAFARLCEARGLAYEVLDRSAMDIASADSVERALERVAPWAVINAAGYVRVDAAEADAQRCRRENTLGPQILATACARHGLGFLTFSTDLVFDGARRDPYVESDGPAPLNVYGRTKAEAESRVLACHPGALVVRTSAFFGPWDAHNFVKLALETIGGGRSFAAAEDLVVSPTYVPDLVHACLDLLIDEASGIWHLTNGEAVSWAELARRAAERAAFDPGHVEARPASAFGYVAPRPAYAALGTARGNPMPPLEDALSRYLAEQTVLDLAVRAAVRNAGVSA